MSESRTTTDRDTIRKWTEDRNGVPAYIKNIENEDGRILRIHFSKGSHQDDTFDEISWDEFFNTLEERNLAFLYQEEKGSGEKNTFHKFVNR